MIPALIGVITWADLVNDEFHPSPPVDYGKLVGRENPLDRNQMVWPVGKRSFPLGK